MGMKCSDVVASPTQTMPCCHALNIAWGEHCSLHAYKSRSFTSCDIECLVIHTWNSMNNNMVFVMLSHNNYSSCLVYSLCLPHDILSNIHSNTYHPYYVRARLWQLKITMLQDTVVSVETWNLLLRDWNQHNHIVVCFGIFHWSMVD